MFIYNLEGKMKKIKLTFLIIFSLSISCFAQNSELYQITVLGSVELKEIADEASFYFTVKGVGENLRQAVEDAENKTKIISEKLFKLGIKTNNLSTSNFLSGENYGDKAFLSSSRDYRATIVTKINIDSLQLLQPLLFTVSESDVEKLSNITFSYKDELGLRRRARIEAGLKAKEKAQDIAQALGIIVGRVLLIEEVRPTQSSSNNEQESFHFRSQFPNPFNPVTNFRSGRLEVDETIGSGFFAQTVSVTSQVKVTFAIESVAIDLN
jgi:uncharacterized protein YggE